MEDITDVDCRNTKRVLNYFNNKNLDGYHDLYVQSDTLFLAYVLIQYFLQMNLRILETNILKYMNLILLIFYQHLD